MTKLSVNVNKIATLRNSRGGNLPHLITVVKDVERFGADGITVHPRPDERHIKYADVDDLQKTVTTELNIEGYPSSAFIEKVLSILPTQVTLVPDADNVITSNQGWDTKTYLKFLQKIIAEFKAANIRTSVFVNPDTEAVKYAADTGTDRIELYTESYATLFPGNKEQAVLPYVKAAQVAQQLGLGINAGHDLNSQNLSYFKSQIPYLAEVSIGHALICDALYWGLENTIQIYKRAL